MKTLVLVLTVCSSFLTACGGSDFQVGNPESDTGPKSDSVSTTDGGDTGSSCTPKSQSEACAGRSCGPVWDGCSGTVECGSCPVPKVCGGGGVPGQCGCTPLTKTTACAGRNCGPVSDGCGGTYVCGTCSLPETCEGQTPSVPGVCGCTPKEPSTVCGSKTCGTAPDGCGGKVSCGTCTGNKVCGAVAADRCDFCPNNADKLTPGQVCPASHPVPRQCPSTAFIMPDCVSTFFTSGTTPVGQYCCTF